MKSCIRKNGGTCSAIGCTMRRGTNLLSQVKMFSFPRDPVRRKAWGLALKRKNWTPTNHSLLCSFHFISGRPSSDSTHPDYVPSIFCFNEIDSQRGWNKLGRFQRRTVHARATSERNSVHIGVTTALGNGKSANIISLSNPGCLPSINMGHENESTKACLYETCTKNSKNVSCLNGESKTSKILETQNITRTTMNFSDESCESFATDSIYAKNTTIIKCICSGTDEISETNKCTLKKENADLNLIAQNISSMRENFSYKNLLKNLSLIKIPNVFWGISCHSNAIICARWSENYTCEKKVVIENSLIARAFLEEWEINLSELMNITCINDVSNLLEKVESCKIVKFKD